MSRIPAKPTIRGPGKPDRQVVYINLSDRDISENLRKGEQDTLKYLHDLHFKNLVVHSMKMVVNMGVAEEIVQDVFIHLWNIRHTLTLIRDFRSYLFTAVKNRSVNYLKSTYGRTRFDDLDQVAPLHTGASADGTLELNELRQAIHSAVNHLPSKCRVIFNLSRNAGLSAGEIALELGISKKTVHAQLAIAMRKIRKSLSLKGGFLP